MGAFILIWCWTDSMSRRRSASYSHIDGFISTIKSAGGRSTMDWRLHFSMCLVTVTGQTLCLGTKLRHDGQTNCLLFMSRQHMTQHPLSGWIVRSITCRIWDWACHTLLHLCHWFTLFSSNHPSGHSGHCYLVTQTLHCIRKYSQKKYLFVEGWRFYSLSKKKRRSWFDTSMFEVLSPGDFSSFKHRTLCFVFSGTTVVG